MKVFSMKVLTLLAVLSGTSASGVKEGVKSPVEKVVKLLEELKANLEHDQKVEQQIYDRFACWCETTTGAKAAAIQMGHAQVIKLTTLVLELKGKVAVLAKEIADLTGKIAENEESQKSATAVRTKENAAWMQESEELTEAINALERAIKVLSGAGTKTGLLQGESVARFRQKALASVRSVMAAFPMNAKLSPKQLSAIESFAKEFEGQPEGIEAATADASYSPASATVQGILKDMYDTFTADLESQTTTEATKQRDYEDLIATLVKEVNVMKETVLKREEEKAEASQELADTIQELDDTQKTLDADIEFFDKTKGMCKAKHEEWTIRSDGRLEEIKGIKEALKILTSDEARELFGKAIKPGMETMFMQLNHVSSAQDSANKAYDALKKGARRAHSLRLAALAAAVRTMGVGHFDKVIEKIDEMIEELKKEEKEDAKQRDWCKDEYHENAEEKAELKWLIKNNEAMITKLEEQIAKLVEEIDATVNEIEATKEQIKKMEEEREEEHDEFKVAKKDDEAAIELLEKTVEVLGKYYKKNKIEMGPVQGSSKLLQEPEFEKSQWQAPDAKFSDAGNRKNQSKGIISILTMLIEDLQAEIKNGVKDEVAAQGEFEKNVDSAKALIEQLEEKKANLEEDKASTEEKLSDEHEDMKMNSENLETNEDYKKKITPDCDWMLNSFEERREKRKAEMNGLVTAKEFLAGGTPSMMQDSVTFDNNFDDTKLQRIGFESLRR
jgi:chromosome segregation ATPase